MEWEEKVESLFQSYLDEGVPHIATAATDRFRDMDSKISVWDEFNRSDYEYFRPEEALPKTIEESHRLCVASYRQFGVVKKMVDLISDFVCKGIRLYHPQKSSQQMYDAWWKYINGPEITSTFTNYLVRSGNVITVRETETNRNKLVKRLAAFAEIDQSKHFAVGYNIYLPTDADIINKDMCRLSKNKLYALKIDFGTQRLLRKKKLDEKDQFILDGLPEFIKKSKLVPRHNAIIMPPDKTRVFHYKKDTTDNWAYSIIHAILDDLILLKKMKLCDLNAADGLISHIMHCKVGDLEHKIIPNSDVLNAYNEAFLACIHQGRPIRITTGPEVNFEFHVPDTAAFLTEDKYKAILASIYAGFGVPPALTGQSNTSGLSNNAISLEVLIQCLEDIRKELIRFWSYEIKLFQKAMGFQKPAKLIFDHPQFQDRHAILSLIIQLVDRKIISADRVREVFGFDPEIEGDRLDKEYSMPEERRHVSALADAQPLHSYRKIALQAGQITPGQVGVEVSNEDRNDGEKTTYELEQEKMKAQKDLATQKTKGVSGQGRPPGQKDSTKRKPREVKS